MSKPWISRLKALMQDFPGVRLHTNMVKRQSITQCSFLTKYLEGSCSAGVIGLQTSGGSDGSRIPHYKLFGLSLSHTRNLCLTGLALQIRVSKPCQELLASAGQFQFERCPDYTMWSARRPIESYWLVGREGMELTLPSLELALPLTEYDDTHI